jgi:tRNA nucleotidyltransferase (CCA-adding enzyme)
MPEFQRELLTAFHSGLSPAEAGAVKAATSAAREVGAALFLIGGPVRDLFMSRQSKDIDIAVEGDIEALAADVARAVGARVVQHGRFGTATLRWGGFTLDFARTRRETYAQPGALPAVEPAGIEDDLARRDFTINAMALRLTEPAGELMDPFGGREDIAGGRVRVLHDRSFRDDATRMIRACRYAARLQFTIEERTEYNFRRDIRYLETISGARLRQELARCFTEQGAPDAARLLADRRVLKMIHPALGRPPGPVSLQNWRGALAQPPMADVEALGFCMISVARTEAEVLSLSERLSLSARVRDALTDLVRLEGLRDKLVRPSLRPSEAVDIFDGLSPAAVWALALKGAGRAGRLCALYLDQWRRIRPSLNGNDLAALGIVGAQAGEALRALRRGRLDGWINGREEEIDLIRRQFL